ncbi:ATP-binding protein [Streptomyces sp. NPDC001678]|uniref:ATP-binding protein n=1 Tax=Streptomyces sp. NPDC001678 TaxID=3364599 RepID=UPI0036A39F88
MQVLQVQIEVGADPSEVGRARRWARSRLAGCGIGLDEPLAETLILLISELVTNAVVHTGCPAVLRMLLPGTASPGAASPGAVSPDAASPGAVGPVGPATGGRPGTVWPGPVQSGTVRVEVADISARPPTRRWAEGGDTGGRGLELVDGLADRWGWQREGAGKRVWCEVDRGGQCWSSAFEPQHAATNRA